MGGSFSYTTGRKQDNTLPSQSDHVRFQIQGRALGEAFSGSSEKHQLRGRHGRYFCNKGKVIKCNCNYNMYIYIPQVFRQCFWKIVFLFQISFSSLILSINHPSSVNISICNHVLDACAYSLWYWRICKL